MRFNSVVADVAMDSALYLVNLKDEFVVAKLMIDIEAESYLVTLFF